MGRKLLTFDEIKELNGLIRENFLFLTNLRERNSLATNIMYPRIPASLTESLTIHLLETGILLKELEGHKFYFGGTHADIIAELDGEIKSIEVKATGKSGFEYFGPKDITADYIIWLHFDSFYLNPNVTKIKIFIIQNPRRYFEKPLKITIDRLKHMLENHLVELAFDFG